MSFFNGLRWLLLIATLLALGLVFSLVRKPLSESDRSFLPPALPNLNDGVVPVRPTLPSTGKRKRSSKPKKSDDDLLAASIAQLSQGRMGCSAPQKMKTGQTERVVARIGNGGVAVEAFQRDLSHPMTFEPTPVSTRMKVVLKSADFDITSLSSDEQIVLGEIPTTWEWQITPKRSGKLYLHLAAIVLLKNLSRDFTTIDREIAVEVDPLYAAGQFVQANWAWVFTTFTAAVAACWKLSKDRKGRAGQHS